MSTCIIKQTRWCLFFVVYNILGVTYAMNSLKFEISKTWDGDPVSHAPVKLELRRNGSQVFLDVEAPFFNDSDIPNGKAGEPVNQLWDHEVVEAFFLGKKDRYLEVELSPYGVHLVLFLDGYKKCKKTMIPLQFEAKVENGTWTGRAKIPLSYFPPKVSKFNAYAIHGPATDRHYLALYPVPKGLYPAADFHRLDYFQNIPFIEIVPEKDNENLSADWTEVLH